MSNAEARATSPNSNDPLFDQFKLAEEFGNNYMLSNKAMRVLRKIRSKGPITEKALANDLQEKTFMYEWSFVLARLAQIGYIQSELTERNAKLIQLTEQGEEFLLDRLGVKIPELPPVVDQLESPLANKG